MIGLIRKYGDNGSSVFLEPETVEGQFTMAISPMNGGILVEALEEDPPPPDSLHNMFTS